MPAHSKIRPTAAPGSVAPALRGQDQARPSAPPTIPRKMGQVRHKRRVPQPAINPKSRLQTIASPVPVWNGKQEVRTVTGSQTVPVSLPFGWSQGQWPSLGGTGLENPHKLPRSKPQIRLQRRPNRPESAAACGNEPNESRAEGRCELDRCHRREAKRRLGSFDVLLDNNTNNIFHNPFFVLRSPRTARNWLPTAANSARPHTQNTASTVWHCPPGPCKRI